MLIACFVLFLAMVAGCLAAGLSVDWALLGGLGLWMGLCAQRWGGKALALCALAGLVVAGGVITWFVISFLKGGAAGDILAWLLAPRASAASLAAVAAGVVGSTGVESAELIRALVREIEPGFVIAIDALASRSAQRLGKTVQIADTGITPGSGVGNARAELSRQTLGIPVIALGVPTVVDAGTLAADLSGREPDGDLELERMMVTPREIDTLAADTGKVVGYGVSLALQTGLDVADLELLLG